MARERGGCAFAVYDQAAAVRLGFTVNQNMDFNRPLVRSLHRSRSRIEQDLHSSFLCSSCQMLVEGSTVENPSDWSSALESKNLTCRGMKDRAADLVLYERVWKRRPEAFHAVDADVTRAV
jgi:hypothetical protein